LPATSTDLARKSGIELGMRVVLLGAPAVADAMIRAAARPAPIGGLAPGRPASI
jgi:hypothetical protein